MRLSRYSVNYVDVKRQMLSLQGPDLKIPDVVFSLIWLCLIIYWNCVGNSLKKISLSGFSQQIWLLSEQSWQKQTELELETEWRNDHLAIFFRKQIAWMGPNFGQMRTVTGSQHEEKGYKWYVCMKGQQSLKRILFYFKVWCRLILQRSSNLYEHLVSNIQSSIFSRRYVRAPFILLSLYPNTLHQIYQCNRR